MPIERMSDNTSPVKRYARQGGVPDASRYRDDEVAKALDSKKQTAMFAIPTHATTHAPGASNEDLAEIHSESSSDVRLEGRPAPTLPLDGHFDVLQARKQLEAQVSVVSSAPSSSSQNTVKPLPKMQRQKSAKQRRQSQNSPSIRADEARFSSILANETTELPSYDAQSYPMDSYGNREELPPALPGPGRFPRWRGWLEKRALERHLERLDTAVAAAGASQEGAPVIRKKSWGAGVDDENALSDGEEQDENDSPALMRGPLHLHHLGSRFITHIPSLPLCSAFLDLPPAPQSSRTGQRLLRRSIPEGAKRKVLLIGTSEGLYVAESRRSSKQDSLKRKLKAEGKKRELGEADWNGNIRCRKVWSGMGIYQMSILNSKAVEGTSRSSKYGFSFLASPPQDVSIMLALCSTVKDNSKIPVVLNVSTSAGVSSSKDGTSPSVSTSHFGSGNGGGPTKVGPPSGSGTVRMWSLEALRRVVAHTLDAEESSEIDMLYNSSKIRGSGDKKSKLAMRIRKAWASLGEPSSDRRARRASRQLTSQSMTENREATPRVNEYRSKMSAEPEPMSPTSPTLNKRIDSDDSEHFDEFGRVQRTTTPGEDSGYEESLRLAQSSVLIKLPGHASASSQQVNLGQGGSLTSLNSEQSVGMSPTSTSGHGSSTQGHASARKGVLFFSVFEASSEVGTTGTWYLALATTKSIYLYEAPRPTNPGESRMWVFVKEYYTPMTPRGVAFTYSEANEADEPTRAPTPSRRHHHSQQSLLQTTHQHQVKSSPYSSVFRSHSDLTLFVSFGRRAVLIRAGDASVKEVEMNVSDGEALGSVSSDAGHGKLHQQSLANTHKRRSLSADLMGGIETGLGAGQWIGAEKITSQVIIRCKHHSPLDAPSLAATSSDQRGPVSRFDDGEDDDDDDDDGVAYDGLGVTLEDVPLPLRSSTSHTSQLLSRESAVAPAATIEPAHVLHARVALLTKGINSYLFPLPLSWDLLQQRPLGVYAWSDTPTAVMAWSKVIGLERDLSSGPISISSLGSSRKKAAEVGNAVTLHVTVTAVAFLSSKIELKRKRIKVQIKVPFVFNRDSELELEPLAKEEERDDRLRDKAGAEEEDIEEESEVAAEAAAAVEQELEYLCGLLSVAPEGHDVAKPWEAGSDAGAWAFDWRGANDFRLFFVSARV